MVTSPENASAMLASNAVRCAELRAGFFRENFTGDFFARSFPKKLTPFFFLLDTNRG